VISLRRLVSKEVLLKIQ